MIKVLNLYAGIGGNRKLWTDCEVTAVEMNSEIAKIYQDFFPDDTVIVGDAHQYLLDHYKEFDFIWASPPCPTHSRINTDGQKPACYPDMQLWQEIIMLGNNWYKGKWVVENVIPYYPELIKPTVEIGRHYFWSNFKIPQIEVVKEKSIADQTGNNRYGFNLMGIKATIDKRKTLRNLVDPETGLHIFNQALERMDARTIKQTDLFNAVE